MRLQNRRTGFDEIYAIGNDGRELEALANGAVVIRIRDRQITVDVTDGSFSYIKFRVVDGQPISVGQGNWLQRKADTSSARWNSGWEESWYKPYAMTTWVYDDSTIEKWYGAGFAWFLLRLVGSVVMAVVDTVLSFFFIGGQLAYMLDGPTGRNIFYGLVVLSFIGFGFIVMSEI